MMKRKYIQWRCHREPQEVGLRYGLPYGMGFGEQAEKKSMDFAFWSKGAGGETPLKSGYVLAYHERMQQCIKQGGTAGMRMNVLSRHRAGMGFFCVWS